jgi:hypothetical protein
MKFWKYTLPPSSGLERPGSEIGLGICIWGSYKGGWLCGPMRGDKKMNSARDNEKEQLADALCYKPEVRGLDSQWGHWIFN